MCLNRQEGSRHTANLAPLPLPRSSDGPLGTIVLTASGPARPDIVGLTVVHHTEQRTLGHVRSILLGDELCAIPGVWVPGLELCKKNHLANADPWGMGDWFFLSDCLGFDLIPRDWQKKAPTKRPTKRVFFGSFFSFIFVVNFPWIPECSHWGVIYLFMLELKWTAGGQ